MSATTKTFRDVIVRSYTDVNEKDGIVTDEFLEATDGMIDMFDLFGNSAFAVVQNDMKNNVKKIRTRFLTDPLANNTLGNLMANESHLKKRTATEAVLWLKRGLDFTARSLKHSLDHPNEELTVSFSLAYNDTLRPYHSFIVRPIFNLAMNACPWRKDFYQSIGVQDTESITLMNGWLDALLYLISVLEGIFDKHPEYTKH